MLILQRDLRHIRETLPGWTILASNPLGTLVPWAEGEVLPDDVRYIWCRPRGSDTWRFQLTVIRTEGDRWVFPRDSRITGKIADLSDVRSGILILSPVVQLLYKSRVPHRPKDASDLQRMIPRLSTRRQAWLLERVELLYPDSPVLGHFR